MSDENKEKNSGKDRKSGDVKVPPRNWLIWTLILVAIPVVIFFRTKTESSFKVISRQELEILVAGSKTNGVTGKIYYPPPQSSMLAEISGKYLTNTATGTASVPFRAKTRVSDKLEE